MDCKICTSESPYLFEAKVLNKYNVTYYKCEQCGFIQTEAEYWLEEAYGNAITKLDIGMIYRNLDLSKKTENTILNNNFDYTQKFLDYGGGYGMFVRLMRDKGFNFYRHDLYCDNIFAEYFDIKDLEGNASFELLTAFEVFEHLQDPKKEVEKMLTYSDSILFSTELQPNQSLSHPDDWWYFVPETGQHIAFYSLEALKNLANYFSLNLYSNNVNLHLLTRKTLDSNPFHFKRPSKFQRIKNKLFGQKKPQIKMSSLLMKDFDYIKKKINN